MISGIRASISARLIPAVLIRSGRSIRRPSASRPSTRVITMVASSGGENAYCDSGPNGQTSSLIRSEPFSSSAIPSRATTTRQASPARLIGRTGCPTGRLDHGTAFWQPGVMAGLRDYDLRQPSAVLAVAQRSCRPVLAEPHPVRPLEYGPCRRCPSGLKRCSERVRRRCSPRQLRSMP